MRIGFGAALIVAACAGCAVDAGDAVSAANRGQPAGARATNDPPTGGVARIHIEAASPLALGVYNNAVLPAYRTAAEAQNAGANDAASDYRAAHPEWYANTVPPEPDRYRPYGEWETMSGVWTTYSSGMPSTPSVRRMFAEQTIAFIRYSTPKVKAYVVVASSSIGDDFIKAVDSYGISADEKKWLTLVTLPNQTIWLMDYSGFPLVDKKSGALAFTDWIYYEPRHYDDALGVRIPLEFYDANVYRTAFPFEGGNIQADGVGACATTTRALSNTGYSPAKVRNLLAAYAGCKKTYILKDITDDGTGHLDMFFKWVATDEVLIGRYENEITADVDGDGSVETVPMPGKVAPSYAATFANNQQRMDDNAAVFAADKASNGKPFKVSRLPMMTRFKDDYGDLPRTFVNSTFTNGVNVYPSYATASCQNPQGGKCKIDADCANAQHCAAGRCTAGDAAAGCDELVGCPNGQVCKKDGLKVALTAAAQAAWTKAMPTWKHVGLRADTIALWSGAIHCITRTIPVAATGKAIADGLCIGGSCSCVAGGAQQACTSNTTCVGPTWRCGCATCKGSCSGGGSGCSDDADCVVGGGPIKLGSCVFDAKQSCGGGGNGGDGCGGVSYEGTCNGKTLNYCDGTLKQQTCAGCCAWDGTNGYYDCLSGAVCNGCVSACSAGSGGCSSQGTHAWTCDATGACNKRVYSLCSKGCSGGVCSGGGSGGGGSTACPGVDAGGADAGGVDANASDAAMTDTGPNCTPKCSGKSCGSDGCGGSCGTCPFGLICDAGSQCAAPPTDTAGGDAAGPDSDSTDAATADAATADTAATDTATNDTATTDTATTDTAATDTAPTDTATTDTATTDTATTDTAATDTTGTDDSGAADVAPTDTGAIDGAFPRTSSDSAAIAGDGGGLDTAAPWVPGAAPSSMCSASRRSGSQSTTALLLAGFAGLLLLARRQAGRTARG